MARITIPPQTLTALPKTFDIIVKEDHIDIMGHMNVQFYAEAFAQASREMTSLVGITEDYVAARHGGAFMLKNFTQYIAECRLGERATIYTRVVARNDKRYQYMHFMVNETQNRLSATMEVLTTHADLDARKTDPFPPQIAAQIDSYIEQHNMIDWQSAPLSGILSPT